MPVVLFDGATGDEVLPWEVLRIVAAMEGRLRLHLPLLLLRWWKQW
jgi:hypothetical protein